MPEDWERYGYASYEAWIESLAGQSPPDPEVIRVLMHNDWPMPPHPGAGDEDEAEPDDKRGYEKLDA